MKSFSILLGWALLCCLPFQIFGQKSALSKAQLTKTYTFYRNTDPSLNHLNYFEAKRGEMQLSAQSEMVLTEETAGKNGYRHYKYQQFQAGVPIFGSRYILHEKDGIIVTATGHYSPQAGAASRPGINAATAAAYARRAMGARKYAGPSAPPRLCFIDPTFPQVSETLRLAYQVDLQASQPFDKRRYFVDATSGQIITDFALILQEGVPSTAKTRYYGVQNIITDSIAPQQFVLRDPSRGEGIFIYNAEDGSPFTNTSSTWDLSASKDEVALDAHYCTQEYYDMMLADYGWQGQDGQGKALQANVHGGDYANAFWDGVATTFGDGDCNYGPLTTLEVMGHEFTHGMVDYTSHLVYDGESGAINESLADMFGKILERRTDPANFSWDLGHSFLLGPNVKPFRVMDDPNSLEMPAYYQGEFWDPGNDVHLNSSIGNLWFSMLVDGRQGVNELGLSFNVPALGMGKVGQIIFEVNKNYFTEGSDYPAFFEYSVDAAEALYGAGSAEVQAVQEAWKAVGVSGGSSPVSFDLGFSGDVFEVQNSCGLDQYLPVHFQIKNTGTVAYIPSMLGTVTITDYSHPDYTVHLNSTIGPGEVFDIQVNNWLKASEAGFISVDAFLNLPDDYPDNNVGYTYYNVVESATNDLNLYADLSAPDCFATTQVLSIYVSNSSCETVPAGTVLNFTANDEFGAPVWASSYVLTEDLISFGSFFTAFDLPATNANLTLTMYYADDSDPNNNQAYLPNQSYLPITGDYANNFETNAGQDGYLELIGAFEPTILYQNNHFFASSGQYEDPEDFQHCADPLTVFNYEYGEGINATVHACVDFSFSSAPVLKFDLAQFRNASTDTSNYLYSSMLQVKWSGNQTGDQVIFGQPEGQVKHYSFPLPAFFKGALDFKLYAESGHGGLDPTLLNEDDFVLLDNLQLSAPTSGTHELPTGHAILLSPNPARETVNIQAAGDIRTILLQNVSGQTLQTWPVNAPGFDLDLKGLSGGFYWLNIQLADGQSAVKKLVKMD